MPYFNNPALDQAILDVNGASFIGIDTCTKPRLTGGKSNPHRDRVTKVTKGASVMVFQNKNASGYDKMVKRRLEKEGKDAASFTLSPRAWGTRVPNTPFIEHDGTHYLEVIFLSSGKSHYELDGIETDVTFITGVGTRKDEGKQGGLSDKVIIRTFKLESLTRITINGQTFNI